MAVKKKYDESSIKALLGLDGVRAKPSMYLSEKGPQMVFRCVKEVADNIYDEMLAGRNNFMFVFLNPKENEYILADKAEGIPVGINKTTKLSTLETIMTVLHAGGKLDEDSAYEASAGTHGVGVSCVNAVSEKFEVWTCREGKWYHQQYKCGKPQAKVAAGKVPKDVIAKLGYTPKQGTVIRFYPDQSVVSADKGKTKALIDISYTVNWLKTLSDMNKGFEVTVSANGKTKTFKNKEGLMTRIKARMAELDVEAQGKPIVYEQGLIRLALQWTTYADDDQLFTYVSSSPTRDHGTHEEGLRNALMKALKPYLKKTDKFAPKDIYFGLVGAFDWRMKGAEFSSQVKDRLVSSITKKVEAELTPILEEAFKKNKTLARSIIKRACDVKKSKEQIKKMMEGIAGTKGKRKTLLPSVLASSPNCKPEHRSLYCVEGDSAAGTAKKARDSSCQEVLALLGKPLNGVRAKLSDLLSNKAVQNILIAMGYDHGKLDIGERPENHLRINQIFLLADADVDGGHINVLILTVLWRLMPNLFDQGRVFIVDAPLFNAYYKGQRYFGETFADCLRNAPKGMPRESIIRSKGWGEVSAEVLAQVAFEPSTRSVYKVQPVAGEALEYFKAICGSESAARKELLGLE